MSLLTLLALVFTFNVLTFGNGPAMVPLLQAELVDRARVLALDQLLYAVAIGRVTPGQANVYIASIGYFLFGIPGALLGTLAIQIPGYVMLPFMQIYERIRANAWVGNFTRGLTTASVGLIFAATFSIGARSLTEPITWVVFAAALVLILVVKWNQMLCLLLASLLGILLKLSLP
ncbi:MAG TPA: chromate transporter [Anaerolineaceae bacterium]|nr:chromate transporter [Anaerolineaceae bacterium]